MPSKFKSASSSINGKNISPVAYLLISPPFNKRGLILPMVLVTPTLIIFSPEAAVSVDALSVLTAALPVSSAAVPAFDAPHAVSPSAITPARSRLKILFRFFITAPPLGESSAAQYLSIRYVSENCILFFSICQDSIPIFLTKYGVRVIFDSRAHDSFYPIRMPGSKGLSPQELAHRWVGLWECAVRNNPLTLYNMLYRRIFQ